MPLEASLSRLNRAQCLELIGRSSFGRVGVSVDALPAILPVAIALIDDDVVFRTLPGTKLAYAARNAVLAVEADEYDPNTGEGWSVLIRGVARELEDPDEIARARSVLDRPWFSDTAEEHFVRVSSDLVTGRRLHDMGGRSTRSEGRTR